MSTLYLQRESEGTGGDVSANECFKSNAEISYR